MHSGWCEIRPGSLCGWRTVQFVAARFASHLNKKNFGLHLFVCLCMLCCCSLFPQFVSLVRFLMNIVFCETTTRSPWTARLAWSKAKRGGRARHEQIRNKKECAPSGNQTRVWSVAGTYTITVLTARAYSYPGLNR